MPALMAGVEHGCACGAVFRDWRELAAHALEVYPPRVALPLDGAFHGATGGGLAGSRRAASERAAVRRDAAGLLARRERLPARLAADLEGLQASLALKDEDAAADEQSWLFDPRRYLRIAAALAAEISAGELKPGEQVIARRAGARFGVATRTAAQAVGTPLDHGWLIHCGPHVRVAELTAGRQ
jgi:hypothetical protein